MDSGIKQEFSRLAFSLTRTTLKVGPIKTSATKAKNVDDDDNANNVNDNNDNDANDDDANNDNGAIDGKDANDDDNINNDQCY